MSIFIIFLFLSKICPYYVRLNDRFRHSPNPVKGADFRVFYAPVIPANFPVIPAQAGISLIHSEAVEIPFYNGMTALFFFVIPTKVGISTNTAETDQTPIYIGVTALFVEPGDPHLTLNCHCGLDPQ